MQKLNRRERGAPIRSSSAHHSQGLKLWSESLQNDKALKQQCYIFFQTKVNSPETIEIYNISADCFFAFSSVKNGKKLGERRLLETKEDRLQEFKNMRATIRGSSTLLVVGVDVAKDRHHAFFGTADGKTLWKKLVFDNTLQGFKKLETMAEELLILHNLKTVVYGVEPTASYHKPLAEHLIRQQQQVVYVSNVAVKKNRGLLDGRWDKNDTKDAANIADLIGQGRSQFYDLAEEGIAQQCCC